MSCIAVVTTQGAVAYGVCGGNPCGCGAGYYCYCTSYGYYGYYGGYGGGGGNRRLAANTNAGADEGGLGELDWTSSGSEDGLGLTEDAMALTADAVLPGSESTGSKVKNQAYVNAGTNYYCYGCGPGTFCPGNGYPYQCVASYQPYSNGTYCYPAPAGMSIRVEIPTLF